MVLPLRLGDDTWHERGVAAIAARAADAAITHNATSPAYVRLPRRRAIPRKYHPRDVEKKIFDARPENVS